MTKTERILKEQVAALEQLVAIKNEVIAELKSVIASRMNYPYVTWYSTAGGVTVPFQGGAGGGVIIGDNPNGTGGNSSGGTNFTTKTDVPSTNTVALVK